MPKYDTNPLDPDFPERAKAAAVNLDSPATRTLPYEGAETRQFAEAAPAEDPTRLFTRASPHSAQFNGQYVPVNYHSGTADMNRSSSRKVEKIGLPENILTAVPYIPWYLGMVAGLLILFLVPKSEAKVRFHAAQGLAAHIGILIVTTILGIVGNITHVAEVGNVIFLIVTSVMLVIFAIKAWKGKPVHIESVDSLTEWLEDKIKPSGP
ncbi:hypothetical protein BH20ACI2_BH20ACI2_06680 [soil metagenome]